MVTRIIRTGTFGTTPKALGAMEPTSAPLREEEAGDRSEAATEATIEATTATSSRPPAGNLKRYFHNWVKLTNNKFVLKIIKEGYKIQLGTNLSNLSLNSSNPKIRKQDHPLTIEVEDLLNSGAISEVSNSPNNWISNIFTVEKSSGGHRLVIDLKT